MDTKNKFKELVQENCITLTPEGEKLFAPLKKALSDLFNSEEIKNISNNQKNIIGSILSNMVGNLVLKSILENTKLTNMYEAMSDEEFEIYLKEKYGKNWVFATLTSEEFERAQTKDFNRLKDLEDELISHIPNIPISRF